MSFVSNMTLLQMIPISPSIHLKGNHATVTAMLAMSEPRD